MTSRCGDKVYQPLAPDQDNSDVYPNLSPKVPCGMEPKFISVVILQTSWSSFPSQSPFPIPLLVFPGNLLINDHDTSSLGLYLGYLD